MPRNVLSSDEAGFSSGQPYRSGAYSLVLSKNQPLRCVGITPRPSGLWRSLFSISTWTFEKTFFVDALSYTIALRVITVLVACSISLVFYFVMRVVNKTVDDYSEKMLREADENGPLYSREVSWCQTQQLQNAFSVSP